MILGLSSRLKSSMSGPLTHTWEREGEVSICITQSHHQSLSHHHTAALPHCHTIPQYPSYTTPYHTTHQRRRRRSGFGQTTFPADRIIISHARIITHNLWSVCSMQWHLFLVLVLSIPLNSFPKQLYNVLRSYEST